MDASIEHIRATPGFRGHAWPPVEGMSLEANRADLERHADDYARRAGFTYTVLDAQPRRCIGCVYIYPRATSARRRRALVGAADHAELDAACTGGQPVAGEDWPFAAVDYADRG